jgi:thiol-disulfide isomerase/thioredoxin
MRKRIYLSYFLALVVIVSHCQCHRQDVEVQRFVAEYEVIKNTYRQGPVDDGSGVEDGSLSNRERQELEALLKKYEYLASSDTAELLKSKILIEISKFREANQTIDALLAKNTTDKVAAQMAKVHALVGMEDTAGALKLFKEIEPLLDEQDKADRFMGWLYLAFYSRDLEEREAYARKILEAPDLPVHLTAYKANLYWRLAGAAKEAQDLERAGEMLQKAISLAPPGKTKLAWQSELAQLKWLGSPAPPILADRWLNSSPLSLENLRGKVVVIVFWAPWCTDCSETLGILADQIRQPGDDKLAVIGYTKLYGTSRDQQGKKEAMPLDQEMTLLEQYIETHQLSFPIAISYEGYNFEDYKITVIPTVIFIDAGGDIKEIIPGAAPPRQIGNKIKKLLEETNGKN